MPPRSWTMEPKYSLPVFFLDLATPCSLKVPVCLALVAPCPGLWKMVHRACLIWFRHFTCWHWSIWRGAGVFHRTSWEGSYTQHIAPRPRKTRSWRGLFWRDIFCLEIHFWENMFLRGTALLHRDGWADWWLPKENFLLSYLKRAGELPHHF